MPVIHFVTHAFPPAPGGAEGWGFRFVRWLEHAGCRVVTYVTNKSEHYDYEGFARQNNITVRLVGRETDLWAEPLLASDWSGPGLLTEYSRLDFLALKAAITRELGCPPQERNVIVSCFIVQEGFLSSLIAEELHLPHVPVVVGTDFSRGMRNVAERATIESVLRTAAHVVTVNYEQEHSFRRTFSCSAVDTIHVSVDERLLEMSRWQRRDNGHVQLFSDSGYSFKKGTHVLLRAFCALRAQGLDVKLLLCGSTDSRQEEFWARERRDCENLCGSFVDLRDSLESSDLWKLMLASDIYCSATIGEGCSHARAAALCAGMPIVTTRCGEMLDVATDASHVFLADPADAKDFLRTLKDACSRCANKTVEVDQERVSVWRSHFAVARERAGYLGVIQKVIEV